MPDAPRDLPVIDRRDHPRIFASKVLGVFAEGGGTTTFTLAVTEAHRATMGSEPQEANVVVAALTLSNNAVNELMGAIQNFAAAAAVLKAEKPATGAN